MKKNAKQDTLQASPKRRSLKIKILTFESHHFKSLLFFLFLIFITATASTFVFGLYTAKNLNLPIAAEAKNIMKIPGLPEGETPYVETGSPLDQLEINPTITVLKKNIFFHGARDKKQIALTFDAEMTDGMKKAFSAGTPSYDPRIIQILEATQTKATLFLTGMWTELYPQEAHSFGQNPLFEIGSHSYADTSYDGYCYGLKQISDAQGFVDIQRTQKILKDIVGVDNKLFRFPGGCYGQKDLDIVEKRAHLIIVHWDVVGGDGFNQNPSSIVKNVVDNAQNGSIIVLHMNGKPTAPKTGDALPLIIDQLKQKGFEFVKVSELLGL